MKGLPVLPIMPCCAPSKARAQLLDNSCHASANRQRATAGSASDMIPIEGGSFLMGTQDTDSIAADGEGPIRECSVDSFYLDRYTVTNEQFREFVRATGYVTEAQRSDGLSFSEPLFPARKRNPSVRRCFAGGGPWTGRPGIIPKVQTRAWGHARIIPWFRQALNAKFTMRGHGSKFEMKIEEAIATLLVQRNMEEAARSVGVSASTLLRWMKEPEFDAEYRTARRNAFNQSIGRFAARVQCSSNHLHQSDGGFVYSTGDAHSRRR